MPMPILRLQYCHSCAEDRQGAPQVEDSKGQAVQSLITSQPSSSLEHIHQAPVPLLMTKTRTSTLPMLGLRVHLWSTPTIHEQHTQPSMMKLDKALTCAACSQNPGQERLRLEIARVRKRIAGAEKAVQSREAAGEAATGRITDLESQLTAVQQGALRLPIITYS